MSDLEDELGQYKKEVRYLTTEINKIQYEIQNEYCNKSLFEVEKYTLENELAVLKQQRKIYFLKYIQSVILRSFVV